MTYKHDPRRRILWSELIDVPVTNYVFAPLHGPHSNEHESFFFVHRVSNFTSMVGRNVDNRGVFVECMCHEIPAIFFSRTTPSCNHGFKNLSGFSYRLVEVAVIKKW